MRATLCAAAALVALAVGAGAAARADAPALTISTTGAPETGSFMYVTAAGSIVNGPSTTGTNQVLTMPSPSPDAGSTLAGIQIVRHSYDTLGYPLHVALVEKLYAAQYQVPIYATNNDEIWRYDYGAPIAAEQRTKGTSGRPAFKVFGPYHADATLPAEVQPAFAYASNALKAIANLPASQKDLANYGVFFVDDGKTMWVEFGPRFGPGETPHLGCQTQVGRDMVFGYDEKAGASGTAPPKFLQCF